MNIYAYLIVNAVVDNTDNKCDSIEDEIKVLELVIHVARKTSTDI